jgi:hypothetical protein
MPPPLQPKTPEKVNADPYDPDIFNGKPASPPTQPKTSSVPATKPGEPARLPTLPEAKPIRD